MRPVVWHREVAFLLQATLLHVAPVVVGAPHHAASKARFERHCARTVVAAQGNAFQADALGIDISAGFQPVHYAAGPVFAVMACRHAVEAKRFAGARLVDNQRRHASPGQPGRQADAVFHFLGRIQPVDLHQQRCRATHAFCAHQQSREVLAFIRDLYALTVLLGQIDATGEGVEESADTRPHDPARRGPASVRR